VCQLGVFCPVKGVYVQGALPHEAAGHEQGIQRSTKAARLRGQNEAMQGEPILDKLSRAGVYQASEDDVTVEY